MFCVGTKPSASAPRFCPVYFSYASHKYSEKQPSCEITVLHRERVPQASATTRHQSQEIWQQNVMTQYHHKMLLQTLTTNQSKISCNSYVFIYFPYGIVQCCVNIHEILFIYLRWKLWLCYHIFVAYRVWKCDNKVKHHAELFEMTIFEHQWS